MDFYTHVETVEAHQWLPADPTTAGATLGWLLSNGVEFTHGSGPEATLTLHVDGRQMILRPGDWLVHHPEHGYSVIDQNSFEATYQPKARSTSRRSRRSVTNVISGTVGGTVIQTGDYQGTLQL